MFDEPTSSPFRIYVPEIVEEPFMLAGGVIVTPGAPVTVDAGTTVLLIGGGEAEIPPEYAGVYLGRCGDGVVVGDPGLPLHAPGAYEILCPCCAERCMHPVRRQ